MALAGGNGEIRHGWEEAYAANDASSLWSEEPIPFIKVAIEFLKREATRTVLDVGCGDGRNLAELVRAGFVAAGVDVSPSALTRAALRVPSAFTVLDSADEMKSFVDGSVDAVCCFDMFGQVRDSAALVSAFHRVLRPRGVAVFNAFSTADDQYGKGQELGVHLYEYKGTLFKFFEEADIRSLCAAFELVELHNMRWNDPPHGDFRPQPHSHDSWIAYVRKPTS